MPSPRITESLEQAVVALQAGHLVAIPTETVYGLAADATQSQAVKKVFALKGRPADHPLIVHCGAVQQAWRCTSLVTPEATALADAFWPGPLTLVLPRAKFLDPTITAGQDSVAIRIPGHQIARALISKLGKPLVAPSANRFGRVSPTRAQHVVDEFPDADLLVLDGGSCDVGIESTIVDCRNPGTARILRPGKITRVQVAAAIGASLLAEEFERPSVRVSGSLPSHYAPAAKVVLVETGELAAWLELGNDESFKTLVISVDAQTGENRANWIWRNVEGDSQRYAKKLYALFREADALGCDRIVVELPLAGGVGDAVRDRLRRAAYDS